MNWTTVTSFLKSLNWYDYVVGVVVLSGFYIGLRTGLARSALRTLTCGVMTLLSLLLYPTVGMGLHEIFGLDVDSANLQAFLFLGMIVFILCHFAAREIMFRASQRSLPATLDNVGGMLIGPFVMLLVMAWLSLALALTRSPTLHPIVVQESRFGAHVVQPFPLIAAAPDTKNNKKPWFMEPIKRREEPTADGYKKRR
jgi:uncharacterized membrane protein required for colicin V production